MTAPDDEIEADEDDLPEPFVGRVGVRRVAVAGFSLLVVAFVALTRWSAIVASHPAYLLVLVVLVLAAGTVVSVWGGRVWLTRHRPRSPRTPQSVVRTLLAATTCIAVGGVVVYLRPLPASRSATALLRDSADVDVTETLTHLEFAPVASATTGLVFYPGALVDARAYAPTLRPLAAAGFLVVVVKMPLGVAFFDSGAASGVIADHPEIGHWAIGGHSLGGAVASSFARDHTDEISGLVLWAAYPTSPIVTTTELDVLSVSASNDGLATVADIADSVTDLPVDTTFVEIEGAVHGFFGDYGDQTGDGDPTITRADAQTQIIAATKSFLTSLAE